jgi:hypothetical protein
MGADDPELQDREWNILFDRVNETLRRLSEANAFGIEDYWILDDNWGHLRQEIEIRNLNLLKPHIIKSLQSLVSDYPEWEIAIGVDIVGTYKDWPAMGVIVRHDEIVDGLQRQYFPQELQTIAYEGRTQKLGPSGPQ